MKRICLVAMVLSAFGCGQGGDTPAAAIDASFQAAPLVLVDSPVTAARVSALRARFQLTPEAIAQRFGQPPSSVAPSWVLREAVATGFEAVDAAHFRAVVPAAVKNSFMKSASVVLPSRASDAVMVNDDTTHTAVRFALRGAGETSATVANGIVLYPGALHGSDVVHRVHAEGTEDYVIFESRPAVEEIVYDVDVSHVAGVRFVSNTLEFLDAEGVPRLRVAPPYVIDAHGVRRAATLAVDGCGYAANAHSPSSHVVTAPGGPTCVVHVAWSQVAYPALVDPSWIATGSMVLPREGNSVTLLASSKVLFAGGEFGSGSSLTIYTSAELYDPSTGTFSPTAGSMKTSQFDHTGTLLSTGKVLLAGGGESVAFEGFAELYDPTADTFSVTGPMMAARKYHTATLLPSGKVLVAGGDSVDVATGLPISANASSDLYDPVTGTFSATSGLITARKFASATLLSTGKVLVAGGFVGPSTTTTYFSSAELYNPATGTFSATGSMAAGRGYHMATRLPTGKVLFAGGLGPTTLSGAEVYDPVAGTFSATGSMTSQRAFATATLLPTGKVLVAGGQAVSVALSSAELYDPTAGTFSAAPGSMTTARGGHSATLLSNGKVLVAQGGANGPTSAELYNLENGKSCASNGDCIGFCVDGVCCDSACTDSCVACDVPTLVGTCTPVVGVPHGSRAACPGSGPCGGTCDGTSRVCSFPGSVTTCGSTCANAEETDSTCDGAGKCAPQLAHTCGNLICADSSTCKATCASDADCVSGYSCNSKGQCDPAGTCTDDHTSRSSDGTPIDCTPYKCDTTGSCAPACSSVSDCVAPNVCSESGNCIATPSSDSGGCNSSGSATESTAFWALAAIATAMARRRKTAQSKDA